MTQSARQKGLLDPTVLWTYCCFLAEGKSLCGLRSEQSGFQLIRQNNRAFKFGLHFLRAGFRWLFLYWIAPWSLHSPVWTKAVWRSEENRSSDLCPATGFCCSHPQGGLRIWLKNWSVAPGQTYTSGFSLRQNLKILGLHRPHHNIGWVKRLLAVLRLCFLESAALGENSTRLWVMELIGKALARLT